MLVVVCLGLAWCLLHDHISPGVLLEECTDGNIGISDLVLEVSEALIAQLRCQTARLLSMVVGWQSYQTGLVGGRASRWLDYNAPVLVVATAITVPPQHRIRQIRANQVFNPTDVALKLFDRGLPIAVCSSMLLLF